jgi:hypothetical protein
MTQLKLTREQVEARHKQAEIQLEEGSAKRAIAGVYSDWLTLFDENAALATKYDDAHETEIEQRKEIAALKAALAEAPCQKPRNPEQRDESGNRHFKTQFCPDQSKPRDNWCLPCQCRYPEGKDG